MTGDRPKAEQLPLFPTQAHGTSTTDGAKGPTVTQLGPVQRESSLAHAIGAFVQHMRRSGNSTYTINAFRSDLGIFARYAGPNRPIAQVTTQNLNDFLTYLRHDRGVPCSPKSYHRRVTALKSFFGWLHETKILPNNPAEPIIHRRIEAALPQILFDNQLARLLETARARMTDAEKPDARPYLLITLLVTTGIKKGECMALTLGDLDFSDPESPTLYVRYTNPRYRKKERKLKLPDDFERTLKLYQAQYKITDRLFPCTARNLEYVLRNLAGEAALKGGCSFEMLRMTGAVRDRKRGMPSDRVRQKLGLSEITWQETGEKIEKLAGEPL